METMNKASSSNTTSPRQVAFEKFMVENAHVSKLYRWGDVLRHCRSARLNWIRNQLNAAPLSQRRNHYTSIVAPKLSGCECLYAQWVYNLFGDDETRECGEMTPHCGFL